MQAIVDLTADPQLRELGRAVVEARRKVVGRDGLVELHAARAALQEAVQAAKRRVNKEQRIGRPAVTNA